MGANEQWDVSEDATYTDEQYTAVSERLLGVVFGVAAQIVEEDICSMEDVDRGAKVGLRWARGPFEMMNRIGVGEACRMAKAYAQTAGEGWTVPAFFADQGDGAWDFSYVDSNVSDGIATITINRPEAMNALNVLVIGQLTEAVAAANADDTVHTIVLDGAGPSPPLWTRFERTPSPTSTISPPTGTTCSTCSRTRARPPWP